MQQKSYQEIRDHLDRVERFLVELGLARPGDRLQQMAKNIDQLDSAIQTGALEELAPEDRMGEFTWSLVEAAQMEEIHKGLSDYPDRVELASKLKRALGGPLDPSNETVRSASARNIAFELDLAARLRSGGFEIDLTQTADVVATLNHIRLFVECKRPLKMDTIHLNIRRARRQLRTRLDASDRDAVGLIAIDASKALNPGTRLFTAGDERDLQGLWQDLIDIHSRYGTDLERWPDLRIVGIAYLLRTPAWIRSENLLVAAAPSAVFLKGDALGTSYPAGSGEILKKALGIALSQ